MPCQSPYKVYCRYCAIKAHLYTASYNILKYGKKTTVTCPSAGALAENLKLARKVYDRWKKNITNIRENYADDLLAIAREADFDWKNVVAMSEDSYPLPFRMMYGQKISMESWCLLDDLLKLSDKYNQKWQDGLHLGLASKGHKYRMLLNVTAEEAAAMTPRTLGLLVQRQDKC